MTIWVPGEGDQGMAGVTIAARDTLRWCSQLILSDVCISITHRLLHQSKMFVLRLRVSPTRQQVYSEIPDWVGGSKEEVEEQRPPPPPPLPPRWPSRTTPRYHLILSCIKFEHVRTFTLPW